MNNEIINNVSRHPRRTDCNVYVLCGNRRRQHFLDGNKIIVKITVVFIIGCPGRLPLADKVARQILVRCLPALIESLVPSVGILVDRPLQRRYYGLIIFTGN